MKKLMLLFAIFALLGLQVNAQKTVTGTVTDQNGGTLPGVSVLVKGTTVGTMTLNDGTYSISVPEGSDVLVFSYIAMKTIDVAISGDVVNAVMLPDDNEFEEVVITALGITREKKSLGYSATTIGGDDFEKNSSIDAMNSLQGKVSGVVVTSSGGSPGSSTKVIIRGYSSVKGGNNPLYVVDGVPIDNTVRAGDGVDFGNRANDINPNDIASMTILKGAAATAQYGPRGANGVVMITTKQGKNQKGMSIEFNSSVSAFDVLRLPSMQNTFGQGWSGHWADNENGSWGPKLDGVVRPWGNVIDGGQQLKSFEALPNNLYDFYEFGTQYSNSLSLSGGNETSSFYVSYANSSADGVIPTDVDKNVKNLFSLKTSHKTKLFTATANANYVRRDGNLLNDGSGGSSSAANLYSELLQVPRDFSIVDFADYKDNPFNSLDEYYTPYAFNPYYALNENQTSFFENRFYGNISLDSKITEWLSATYRIGVDASSFNREDHEAIMRFTPGSTNSLGVIENPGFIYEENSARSQVSQDLLLKFSKSFNDFSLNGLIGFSSYQVNSKSIYGEAKGLVIPYFYNLDNASGIQSTSTYEYIKRTYGYFAEANVGYKDFAYLNLTGRRDHSSTLPLESNSFFYPSASVSVLADKLVPALGEYFNLLKVRASWGLAGNDADVYKIYPIMVSSSVYIPYGSLDFPGSFEVSNIIGNPNLEPEITTEMEFGTEMHVFKSRLIVDFSYYNRVSSGQILNNAVAPSSGFASQVINFGDVENKGIELLLSVYPVKTKNFSWGLSVNYTKNNNKVLSLPGDATEITLQSAYGVDMVAIEGEPLGVIRSIDYTYDNYVLDADGEPTLVPAEGAHVIVNSSTGIPTGSTEKTVMGNIQPDYILGATNMLKYKNFDLSITIDYRPGGLMYSGTADLNYFVGNATLSTYNDRQPFLYPNSVIVNPNYDASDATSLEYIENDVPISMSNINAYYYHTDNTTSNRARVISRDYFKLRDVSLSYNVPSKYVKKAKLSGIQFVISGRNLLLFTPEDNNFVDPEASSYGNDLAGDFGEFRTGPTVRSFIGSIRIKF